MVRRPRFVLRLIFCFSAITPLGSQQNLPGSVSDHTDWIAGVLKATESVKPE